MECPFCKIIKKQADAHIIHETENIIAFFDIDPINEGHAHFHVFPRYKNDGFGWKYPEGPFECSENVAEQIRNAMHRQ